MQYNYIAIPTLTGLTVLIFFLSYQYFSIYKFSWQHRSNFGSTKSKTEMRNIVKMLQSVDFEVFGNVQGVFFRKYTREKGKVLGLKGWVMNTAKGTVLGTMQGKEDTIEEMKDWLRHTGSPTSRIEKCVFSNDRHITKEEFTDFFIKKKGNFY